jgi:hypothetical protein
MGLADQAKRNAYAGFFCWFAALFLQLDDYRSTDLIEKVILFGVFVVVPLGLSLIAPTQSGSRFFVWSIRLQPFAAATAALSLLLETGLVAAVVASLTLVFHLLVALAGLSRLLARGVWPIEELSIDAGLIYLPVAGFWLVVYRLGIQPFGFSETIILLTVVHFHFAGFATPLIAGMTGRFLSSSSRFDLPLKVVIIAVISSMPLVALGITFFPLVALVGAVILTVGTTLLAVITLGWVQALMPTVLTRIGLIVSSLANLVAMVMACLYAYSIAGKILIFDIPTMARFHGLLNAFGFVACSLFVWSAINQRPCSHKEMGQDRA